MTPRSAVWAYDLAKSTGENAAAVSRLAAFGFDLVFLSAGSGRISESGPDRECLADFVTQARERGIAVHAMILEDPVFTLTAKHSRALEHVRRVLAYNAAHPAAAFAGIHLDTEPHALPAWARATAEERENLLRQYVALLATVRDALAIGTADAGQKLILSAAIGWWYNAAADRGLPSGDAALLATHLDLLVPMVYGGIGRSVEDIVARVQDTVRKAPTIIGLGAQEFPTASALRQVIAGLEAYSWVPATNFRGTAVFRYESLPLSAR